VFDEWVRACPLECRSGIAPGKHDVPGSLLLAILAAHRRYEHVTWLRGDAVAALPNSLSNSCRKLASSFPGRFKSKRIGPVQAA